MRKNATNFNQKDNKIKEACIYIISSCAAPTNRKENRNGSQEFSGVTEGFGKAGIAFSQSRQTEVSDVESNWTSAFFSNERTDGGIDNEIHIGSNHKEDTRHNDNLRFRLFVQRTLIDRFLEVKSKMAEEWRYRASDDSESWYFYAHTQRADWKLEWGKKRYLDPKGKMRFRARRRKWTSNTSDYEVVQERFFSTKWRARDWCWKWYCKYNDRKFESTHTKSEGRSKAGKKLAKVMTARKESKKAGLKCVRRRKVLRRKVLKSDINIEGFGSFLEKKPRRKIQTKKSEKENS